MRRVYWCLRQQCRAVNCIEAAEATASAKSSPPPKKRPPDPPPYERFAPLALASAKFPSNLRHWQCLYTCYPKMIPLLVFKMESHTACHEQSLPAVNINIQLYVHCRLPCEGLFADILVRFARCRLFVCMS